MHIFCASYNNIGPFENQTITIVLKDGTYLIKAPIGSGKSFLFFDGLVYALYGYSKRDMLNVQCTTGWTKVLFADDHGDVYLIQRPLTGKKGTQLWRLAHAKQDVVGILDSHFTNVLTYDKDFTEYIDTNALESIDFHTSTEIQQHIDLLLPPRVVFLQRHILMQDSENIFELQPKARIDVLKLLFGLDMIDSIKDTIGDIKNELRGQYKVLTESAHITESYQSWYDSFTQCVSTIRSLLVLCADDTMQTEFDNIGLNQFLEDPLSKNADSLKYDVNAWSLTGRTTRLEQLANEHTHHQSHIRLLQQQQQNQQGQIRAKQQELDVLQSRIDTYRQQLGISGGTNDPQQGDIQKTLTQLTGTRQLVLDELHILNNLIQDSHRLILQSYDLVPTTKNVLEYLHLLDSLKQVGIAKKYELDALEAKTQTYRAQQESRAQELLAAQKRLDLLKQKEYDQLIQSHHHAIGLVQRTTQELDRQYASIRDQLQQAQKTLDTLTAQSQHLSQFHCDRIQADCPFIEKINEGALSKLHGQIQQASHHKITLDKSLSDIQIQLQQKNKELLELQNEVGVMHYDTFVPTQSDYQSTLQLITDLERGDDTPGDKLQLATLQQQYARLQDQIQQLKSDYLLLHGVLSASDRERYVQLIDQQKELEASITTTQQYIQQQQHQLQEYHALVAQYDQQHKQMLADIAAGQVRQDTILQTQTLLQKPLYTNLPQISQVSKQLQQLVDKIQDLHKEKKRVEEKTAVTKQQLDIATDLHAVFSKELTLYVLQSYIPVLNNYINAFLAKVVDLQLSIAIGPDGDELVLLVEDERGTREVKSLSGGQKTVLRLCWILATSVVFGNSFLLLDETINNMDTEVVGKVAELLSDYVKQHNTMLYIVTHSEQIQHMSIWSDTIHINAM